ncbi:MULTISPECIES: PfkB family carbohydrate kinase [unclassified Sphingobium]|uniref:PfkB family carbohydrate kinase n=1 Tax=unclassified Sphingobium TaxID=2611147 RepID=UPI0035A727C8
MQSTKPNLACVGDNTVDVYVDKAVMFPGGNAVNVAVIAKRAQIETAYVGCLGQDKYGDLVLEALAAEGVDISHCSRDPGPNGRALVRHTDGDRVFAGAAPGVRARIKLDAEVLNYLSKFAVLHTSINSDLDDKIDRLAGLPGLLSYDFSNRWTLEQRHLLGPRLYAAFFSASELDDQECDALLNSWAEAGVTLAVATRGARGAVALHEGVLHHQAAMPTTVVDTLGAGDGFVAGVLSAIAERKPLPLALEQGASFAAATCTLLGAFGHAQPASGDDFILPTI